MSTESMREALNRAFQLGQTYWQQADSDSYKQNAKSDVTRDAFRTLVDETCAALAQRADESERMGLDAIRAAIEDRDAMEAKYRGLAEHMVYHGNSVSWWHSKATAYRDAVGKVWDELKAAGIVCDGKKTSAEGVRELAKLAAAAAPAYVPLDEFERMLVIGDEFPIPLVQPIIIQKVDSVCRVIESLVVARMRGEGK